MRLQRKKHCYTPFWNSSNKLNWQISPNLRESQSINSRHLTAICRRFFLKLSKSRLQITGGHQLSIDKARVGRLCLIRKARRKRTELDDRP